MRKRILSLVLVLSMLCAFVPAMTAQAASIDIGDYVQMGTYYGEPILWRCVDIDENGPLMLADKIICLKPYDAETSANSTTGSHSRRGSYESNYWADSNMRSWLNSNAGAGNVEWLCGNPPIESEVYYNAYDQEAGFMTNFTTGELNAVKEVTQKSILSTYDKELDTTGATTYLYYDYDIADVVQNYDSCYAENITDKFFLLDVKQVNAVYNNSGVLGEDYYIGEPTEQCVANSEYTSSSLAVGKKWYYWLRSPRAYSIYYNSVRYVYSSGSVYNYYVSYGDYGVRPAFYLNLSSVIFESGYGTLTSPYTVEGTGGNTDPDEPIIDPSPAVTRTVDATFTGGTEIVYNADENKYNADSFTLTGAFSNLFVSGDLNRTDTKAYNVSAEITLPDGYSFDSASAVKTKTFTFDEIDMIENIYETIYLQNPSVGTNKMTAKITGDNVKEKTVTYDFNVEKYVFELNKYRANYLINTWRCDTMENDLDFNTSPSRQLYEAALETDLDWFANAWNVVINSLDAASDPSKIADYAFEEKDIYSAIIMSIFESSVDLKVMGFINNNITTQSQSLANTIVSEMKNEYNFNNFDYNSMSKTEKDMLSENISTFFKQDNASAAQISSVLNVAGKCLKYGTDFQKTIETIVSYYNMLCLSDAMKQVMKDMYSESFVQGNGAMQQAFNECTLVIDSGWAAFAAEMTAYATGAVGKDVAQFLFGSFWGKVKTSFSVAYPGAFAIQAAYDASKYITQVCFNSDQIAEKFFKIEALVNTEKVMQTVYNKEKSNFTNTQSEYTAEIYNSAIDAMFNMYETDCDYAYAFVDAVDSALFSKISDSLGYKTNEELKKQIKTIQGSTSVFHENILTDWIAGLYEDFPSKYEYYESIRYENMTKKYDISCPVDVYVFDTDGVIVGSVVDNIPYCRSDANITIGVYDDTKTIYMYGDEEYNIVYEGNDTGTMDITIAEYDDTSAVTRNVYFNGLGLTDGLTYTSTETGGTSEDGAYVLTSENDESITPDYDTQTDSDSATYTASITRGYFIEDTGVSRELHAGENAEIIAYVPEGCKFIGWTSDAGEDIFEDATSVTTKIRMPASNVNITANIEVRPVMSVVYNSNSSVTVKALNCDDIAGGKVILAVYNSDGTLKDVYTEDFASEVTFDELDLTDCTVKAMLWDSVDGMKPLAEAGSL